MQGLAILVDTIQVLLGSHTPHLVREAIDEDNTPLVAAIRGKQSDTQNWAKAGHTTLV